ncbi:MAG: GHKL domain-containing protein [Faecalibacillus intestinalis]
MSKKGTSGHGIGLSSVKSTLKKYKSEISFSEDKYWFTVLIVIDKYEYIH